MTHTAQPALSLPREAAPPPRASDSSFSERAVEAVERRWPWALGILLVLDLVLLLYMGRGLTFFYDEWDFVQHDYGGGVHSLLAAHVGNIALFPVILYKVLFHAVGLNHYAVYRLMVIALHLISGGLIFVLAARRISRAPALLAAALILFLGAAWEDLLWAFQVGYLLSVVGGLAAWVLLEREDRPGDIAALVCLIVSVGSSSLGIAVMVGVAVELAWRRQWRRGWIVAVPALLYLLWYLGYGESQVTKEELVHAPGYMEDLAAAAFGGLIGRGLDWGRPLALVGALVLLRRFLRPVPVSPRLAGLVATGLSLWFITAAARSTISPPETSRYIYLGAIVIVLVGVELLRGMWIAPRATVFAALFVAFFAVTGLTVMNSGADSLRNTSKILTAELGALELAAAYAPPGYQPDPQRAPQILAGPYLHTVRAMGSTPADTPAEILFSEPTVRTEVDAYLIKLEGDGALAPASKGTHLSGRYPLIANVSGSQPVRGARCWSTTAVGPNTYTEFLLPPAGLLIRATGQAAQVVVRRFSSPLGGVQLGVVASREAAVVKFPIDASGRPWFVRLSSGAQIEVCGVS